MSALLFLLPPLALIVVLLLRRYPGEQRLVRAVLRRSPRRARTVRAAPVRLAHRSRVPRGGLLIASALAVRPPPTRLLVPA